MKTPIFIVSGGKGLPANSIVQSVLVQFPENRLPVKIIPDVLDARRLRKVVEEVKEAGGIIVHTMVDQKLRDLLVNACREKHVKEFDLMGDLFSYLTQLLNQDPINEPGLFRKMNMEYFDRVESIEYTITSDDGLNPKSIHDADIVLTGISRTGKTPTSMYLAMLGWKVANIPLVKGTDPPGDLFRVDPKRVFGLDITTGRLVSHRQKRLSDFGVNAATDYIDPRAIRLELEYAHSIFRRGGFTVIKVTNKPIESVANEIIEHLSGRFSKQSRKVGGRL
jgi:regulator of PEP synthase PpsR (kinase-PPPase family)